MLFSFLFVFSFSFFVYDYDVKIDFFSQRTLQKLIYSIFFAYFGFSVSQIHELD